MRPARAGSRPPLLPLIGPAVLVLLIWMAVPLGMTLYYSFQRLNLLNPMRTGFVWLRNYARMLDDPVFWVSLYNSLVLVGAVLALTVLFGVLLALLLNQDFPGRGVARVLIISPFFVMPVVSALIWKNMLMHPVYGLFAWAQTSLGFEATDWFTDYPMLAVVIIITWRWTPFAMLVFLTSLQNLPDEQTEAAHMDGAGPLSMFGYIVLPHISRAITAVVMIESIFFLAIYAEIFTTTSGGPGTLTTNLVYLIYVRAFLEWNIGSASAGGIFAVILANIVAIFLIRLVARNMQNQEAFG